mmetsp:Transcript_40462/g.97043  ORF Transcript_40462/g.97043 Transcript_40462/m.97043 type:complete len:209 (-) Transcript_40462:202-828(-)
MAKIMRDAAVPDAHVAGIRGLIGQKRCALGVRRRPLARVAVAHPRLCAQVRRNAKISGAHAEAVVARCAVWKHSTANTRGLQECLAAHRHGHRRASHLPSPAERSRALDIAHTATVIARSVYIVVCSESHRPASFTLTPEEMPRSIQGHKHVLAVHSSVARVDTRESSFALHDHYLAARVGLSVRRRREDHPWCRWGTPQEDVIVVRS